MVTRVALGGTFEVIHKGHRALFTKAFAMGDEVLIGLTSDHLANTNRSRKVAASCVLARCPLKIHGSASAPRPTIANAQPVSRRSASRSSWVSTPPLPQRGIPCRSAASRARRRRDQSASIEPSGLRTLVGAIRKIESAMGDGVKKTLTEEEAISRKLRAHINRAKSL